MEGSVAVFADGHVHIHECYDINLVFESAFKNFAAAAYSFTNRSNFTGLLFLTENREENWFQRLKEFANSHQTLGEWSVHLTKEESSLFVKKGTDIKIYLISGKQYTTSENLEVLSLISNGTIEEGRNIEEVIEHVIVNGGVPVIPWGFGKWWGDRGKVVEMVLKTTEYPFLFLGDNGGRPWFIPRGTLFDIAAERGIKILPGSDPLPVKEEYKRIGNFGFFFRHRISFETPAQDIKDLLKSPDLNIQSYGKLLNPLYFLKIQSRIRFNKKS